MLVWSFVVFSFMVLFAVPAVTLAAGLLELDRLFGTPFFRPGAGGNALLYQHLFWFWGHPEVYILFIPATGMISAILPGVRAPRARGLPVDRRLARRDRLHQLRRVGAPHVRDRRARPRDVVLLGREPRHRDTERRACSSAGSRRCGTAA